MRLALALAEQAAAEGEVPVGAVVVREGIVVGRGRNSPIRTSDPTAHAEVLALKEAAMTLGNYRLENCTLYVTLEPCAMCSGAILHSRIRRVVYGADDPKTGCAGSVTNLFALQSLNHHTEVHSGLLAQESCASLQSFFEERRAHKRLQACPLRQDALRTPDARFSDLERYPWEPCYVSTLPVLDGLRMHYLDLGPREAESVLFCLHPIPQWSYVFHAAFTGWLEEGARVIAPDLIGFGKSDKPKREDVHTRAFHVQSLLQLLDALEVRAVKLVHPKAFHPLLDELLHLGKGLITEQLPLDVVGLTGPEHQAAMSAPFPDAGHCAAERAFSTLLRG